MERTLIIEHRQFAYKRFSSCNVALILLVDEWKRAMDRKQMYIAAFLDLRKAFDVINHEILIAKLADAGIGGTSFHWFVSFLKNRKQFFFYCDTASDFRKIDHGVPQESVLEPSLFSIHFNDVLSVVTHSSCTLFCR